MAGILKIAHSDILESLDRLYFMHRNRHRYVIYSNRHKTTLFAVTHYLQPTILRELSYTLLEKQLPCQCITRDNLNITSKCKFLFVCLIWISLLKQINLNETVYITFIRNRQTQDLKGINIFMPVSLCYEPLYWQHASVYQKLYVQRNKIKHTSNHRDFNLKGYYNRY